MESSTEQTHLLHTLTAGCLEQYAIDRHVVRERFPEGSTRMRFRRLQGKAYIMVGGELRRFGPGDIFDGAREELGASLDQWEQLDPDPEPPPPPQPLRGLVARVRGFRGRGEWDVINPETGRAINDRPLTKAEATDLAGEAFGEA